MKQDKKDVNQDVGKDKKQLAKDIVSQVEKKSDTHQSHQISDKLDTVFAHPVFGIIIFGLIMWGVFTISQMVVGPWISGLLETGMGYVASWVETGLENLGVSTGLQAFILEGIIGGFSAIIGFLPLIMVLFFLLNLMEDSGYMTRVALLMDKYFKKIGLAGKSIIPMYVGTACSVPAIMSARTIKNKKQRRLTVLLTPFVPCGAKLPIIALFLGVILGNNRSSYTVLVYLFAIVIIFLTGLLIKALLGAKIEDQEDSYLLVELPEYKLPSLKSATIYMLNSAKTFIKKAGTIILVANALVWLMVSYDFSLTMVAPDASILASLSRPIAWLLTPIGITAWGLAAAAVLGFIAKEEVVGALAIIFVFSVTDDFAVESWSAVREALMTTAGLTTVSALAYMVFNLFTPPCFASIGAMNAELESRWWTVFAVALQLIVGFFSALIIYQFGTLIVTGSVGVAFVPAMILLGAFIAAIIILSNLAKQGKGLGVLD